MSNYQPYEGSQGDPWSTEPVQEPARGRRDQSSDSYYDQSPEVLGRMPDLAGDGRGDSDRYSRRHIHGHTGRRRSSRSPGIPISIWAFGGLVLLAVALIPFFLKSNKVSETALEEPNVWQPDMPAPNAPLAPAWSSNADSQWQQAGAWPQDPGVPATVNAEPGVPGTWNATPPTADWIGAPAGAPYAGNAAEGFNQSGNSAVFGGAAQAQPVVNPPLAADVVPPAWSNVPPPSAIAAPASRAYAGPAEPTAPYSATPSATQYDGVPAYGTNGPVSQSPSWSQPAVNPPLAVPQAETASPGYRSHPAPATRENYGEPLSTNINTPQMNFGGIQVNPHVSQPAASYPSTAPVRQYPATVNPSGVGQPIAASPYGQTPNLSAPATAQPALARRDAYPMGAMPAGITPPMSEAAPAAVTPWGASAYPAQPLQPGAADSTAYPAPSYAPPGDLRYAAPAATPNPPAYPSTATYPSTQPVSPAAPASQPNYGSGAAVAPQSSAARLTGLIQEPTTRAAYNDRARPSFY